MIYLFPFFRRLSLGAGLLASLSLCGQEVTAPSPPAASVPGRPSAAAPPVTLTLAGAVVRALAKNFDLRIQEFNTEQAGAAVAIARSDYDPSLSFTLTRSYDKQAAPTSVLDSGVKPVTEAQTSSLGVTQKVPTGATVGLSTNLDRQASTPAAGLLLNPAYNADVSLSVSQPLLKGAGPGVNLASLKISRLGLDVARLNYRSKVLTVIASTETAYYNLIFAREQLRVYELSLGLQLKLLDDARVRKTTGVATDLDVLTAGVGVANARRQLLLGQQQVGNSEDSLLALIGQFEFGQPVDPAPFDDFTGPVPTFDAVFARALVNQPDYLATQTSIEQLRLDLQVARNAALPNLALGGALGYSGLRDRGDAAYREVGNGTAWQVDLSLSFPWGFRGDRARAAQAKASLNQQQTVLRQLEQNLLVQVRTAVRSVGTNLESVKISSLATELSEKQYELTKAKFDAGLSTARDVQQAQTDLDTARVNELQSKVTLHTALSQLQQVEGTTLEHYHINLPE